MRYRNFHDGLAVAASQNTKEKEYWLKKLSGELMRSNFPYDSSKLDKRDGRLTEAKFTFSEEHFHRLLKTANNSDIRIYIILTAGLIALLNKYTGNNDIIVGTPIFKQESEGEFINTVLVLRSNLSNDVTFKELIMQERTNIVEALENQNYPIEILLAQLDIPISDGDFPLFGCAILLENIHDKKYLQHLNLNIVFSFFRTETAIEGTVEYNASLYKKSTIERIINHFSNLIESVLFNVDLQIADIEIISREEKKQLLEEFNDTAMEYPEEITIHQLFEGQVEKTPGNMAIIFEHNHITYMELDLRANQLARILRLKGVNRETVVGLMVQRSIEMIVGIMGILKAGGAYLPIDIEYPQERTTYMLRDCNAMVLLTGRDLKYKYKCLELKVNIIDIFDKKLYSGNDERLENKNFSSDLAYVIYTSGSTGRPKGTEIEHKNVVNFIKGISSRIDFKVGKSILSITNITFDAFALESLLPMACGMKIVMTTEIQQIDPYFLRKVIFNNKVNMMQITPSRLRSLIDSADDLVWLKGIEELMVGGEAFPQDLYECLKNDFEGKIYNLYGPTETTVWSTLKDLTAKKNEDINIGSPLSNTQVYILDGNLKLVPIGVPGEICIGGDGVARGYLGNPGLTNERFIANPFRESERVYRTGDLARWVPNGDVEFLGRIDFQVKIRGFRIELGEIESQLLKYPHIKYTVVVDRKDKDGNKYLCAYVVSEDELIVSELREHMSRELPDYMIPAFFVQIENIPLTPNGKVDRKALPEPDLTMGGGECVKPRNRVEDKLADIWADVLGIEKSFICIDYNFFEVGGNSLRIALLISKIHKELGMKVKVADIFKRPTIREFSKYINEWEKERYVSIEPAAARTHYELSSPQRRLYILQQMDEKGTSYNMPSLSVLEGKLDKSRLENALKNLINRHESLRTRFKMVEGIPVQIIEEEVEFEIKYHRLETWGSEEKIVNEFVRPFDLEQAPLLRVELAEIEKKYILMIDMHHIISDGTSIQIFLQELMAFYQGETLSPKSIQYKDYSEWQKNRSKNESIIKQEEYWLNQFRGDIPVLALPVDNLRPVEQSFEGCMENFGISIKDTRLLKEIAKKENATLYMILLAVFNIFLSKVCNQEDIIVGTPTAGRRHAELQCIIGMFVNTLAIRSYPESQKTFINLLKELKENVLSGLENQDFQFEELIEILPINRDTSRNPLFDVMFELQNMDLADIDIPGMKLKPYDYENRTSKFDLHLQGVESGEKLIFTLEYCTKLFKKETILRLIGYFKQVVNVVTENPYIKLADIEITDEREKREILEVSRGKRETVNSDETIPRLFERIVEKMGEKTALVFKGNKLTYSKLNKKSNQLARLLITKGVRPNNIVGLLVERSFETIIGLLAIMKAGGAYLPVDPEYPNERKKYMLKNTDVKHLLTTFSIESLKGCVSEKVEIIDISNMNTFSGDDSSLEYINKGSDLAYVIYTSGSTGKPKGVMMAHRNLVNLIEYQFNHTNIKFSKVLQYNTISFDVSFQEIFSTLLAGGNSI